MNSLLRILTPGAFIILLIGLLTTSFSESFKMDQGLSNDSKMLYGFVAKTGRKLEKKYKMSISGIGGGAKTDGIWLMSLSFHRYGSLLTEETARQLIIHCVNDFLEVVNQDAQLQPHLKEYPFTAKNLELAIHNYDQHHYSVIDPLIVTVSMSRGKIGYFTIEKEDSLPYKTQKYETFEEALAILAKENQTNCSKE